MAAMKEHADATLAEYKRQVQYLESTLDRIDPRDDQAPAYAVEPYALTKAVQLY